MNKIVALLLTLLTFSLLVSCVSGADSYDSEEYYSYEEVLEAWMEATYDADPFMYTSAYWEDGIKIYTATPDQDERIYHGREEIFLQISSAFEGFDPDNFEFAEPDIHYEEDRVIVSFIYEDWSMKEFLHITSRGELWAIQEQVIEPYSPPPVRSILQAWADENENGMLESSEFEWLMYETGAMLFYPHNSETLISDLFDSNGDEYIDEVEVEQFRSYLFTEVLPRYVEEHPEIALYHGDLNGDGRIGPREVDALKDYLYRSEAEYPPEAMEPGRPLFEKLDMDQNGYLDDEEHMQFFWSLVGELVMFPYLYDENVLVNTNEREGPRREQGLNSPLTGKRIAVMGIDSVTDSVSPETLSALVLFVENSFVNTGDVTVVDRKAIEQIVEEYSFQSSGITDEATAVEIGKIAGAEIIVTGTLSSIASEYYLQLRLINVQTAEVVASSLGEAKEESQFLLMSDQAVKLLF